MGNVHALIIDDDFYSVKVLAELLNIAGVTHTAIQNPAALDELDDLDTIDVIFLDLEMPVYNGYEVLKILQEDFALSIPIVACTVHTSEINAAKKLGFHSFLSKPLKAEHFQEQLARILNDQPVWEAT